MTSRSRLTQGLHEALEALRSFQPWSTDPEARAFRKVLGQVSYVASALHVIDAYQPGLLERAFVQAIEEAEVRSTRPPDAVTALVARYAGKIRG